jgi:ABC-type phosphate transport system substrate-binding protein
MTKTISFSRALLMLTLGVACTSAVAQVVVVGAKSPASILSKEQVADAFMGRMPGVEPIDQTEGNPIREEFYPRALGKTASQVKSYWSKLFFSGKGTIPKEFPSSAEVKKALAGNPKAIGYIEKSAVDAGVKVVFEVH